MKRKIILFGLCAVGLYATAAPHTWVLKNGDKIEGDYVGTTRKKVFIMNNGATVTIKTSDLSTNDLAYIAETQLARRLARLDKEAKRLTQSGTRELTAKLFDSLADKAEGQPYWLDGKFAGLNQLWTDPAMEMGFSVEDKNSDLLTKCFLEKEFQSGGSVFGKKRSEPNPLAATLSKLQHGDRIRLIGKVLPSTSRSRQRLYHVETLQVIETAATRTVAEDGDEDAAASGGTGNKAD